ncbi:MAG TPA: polymer-forming cytoskeletal protein [Hydrogenophaga sp.]|uniref:bactofilin family protein n=1 Tax=Hydrogenophaga sp. TaxID=1904254 RepID=UPI002C366186|nr:polymer-forming cytoskeletal protein [Hydrogenophaga sp.]HMN92361.1 polymer-forming cytoskeletal protein [Hydrogenophaga sp.]HMP10587.1 polymer-forming cytoskeletal protein [Hydrogenophaga sp.]
MSEQDFGEETNTPADADEAQSGRAQDLPQTIEVPVGHAMPPLQVQHLPTLSAAIATTEGSDPAETGHTRSMLAEGMHFVGNAVLRGPLSVAGHVEGNLMQATDVQVSVVVTETGRVKGDITAHKISVMGHTDGILDSGQGEVALHDTASVHGLVRYGRIQVNGADLNATLERVAPARTPSA